MSEWMNGINLKKGDDAMVPDIESKSKFSVIRLYTFSTYRSEHRFLSKVLREEMRALIIDTCIRAGFEVLAVGVVSDHVHLLLRHGALWKPSEVMWRIKGAVAHQFFENHPVLRRDPKNRCLWSRRYHYRPVNTRCIDRCIRYCNSQYTPDGIDKRWI